MNTAHVKLNYLMFFQLRLDVPYNRLQAPIHTFTLKRHANKYKFHYVLIRLFPYEHKIIYIYCSVVLHFLLKYKEASFTCQFLQTI